MKSGCFLKSIIVLTILVAVITYIIQHKSNFFFDRSKKIFTEAFLDDWNDNFDYVKNTPAKTGLKDSLKVFLDKMKLQNIPDEKDINSVMDMVRAAAADSVISDSELKVISNNLKLIKNERPEQNRN